MEGTVDVVAVGHAIVDVLAPSEDALVGRFGLTKGTMTLVDDVQAAEIYAALGSKTEASGGSAANTAAGLASLGSSVAFVGKVGDDPLGQAFAVDIRAAGVRYEVPAGTSGPGTGRCLIMVTPDAERTMCTSLGIGDQLAPTDVDTALIGAAQVLYLEGYLCGPEHIAPAVEAAVAAAESGGALVSLSLSDPSWVGLFGPQLDKLLDRVDILFGNAQEACAITGETNVSAAVARLAARCPTVVVTRGAEGSTVADGGTVVEVPAAAVSQVVDTTGAGDLFAAGYLYGVVRGLGPERSARLGALAAAEVISHFGARPLTSLATLAAGI